MAGDYNNFDHHSTRFLVKVKNFWEKIRPEQELKQELWTISKKFTTTQIIRHEKGFLVRLFPISLKLPLPLEVSLPLLKEVKKYKTQEPTIWHLHSYYLFMNDLLAVRLASKKQKFVTHFRGGGPSYTVKALWYTAYHYLIGLRIALNFSRYVFVQNHDEEKRVINFLAVKKEKVIYFPNSLPNSNIIAENTLPRVSGRQIKIAYAGRVEKITHNPRILLILERIISENENCFLEIIGVRQPDEILIELQKRFLERITLTGWLKKDELLAKLRSMDLFLHINTKEGFEGSPMTLIEAQSQGVPGIAVDISGVRDVIKDGYNGYLFKGINNLQSAINNAIKNRDNLTRLRANSLRNTRENFTDEKYFPKLIKIYKELLKPSLGPHLENQQIP